MALALYPRAAPGDQLVVWVGAFGRTSAPSLDWTLNGAPAAPEALRPLASVRPDELLGADPARVARVFSGVYRFAGVRPDTVYRVEVRAGDEESPTVLTTRTLPERVPSAPGETFNVLLVSCFCQAEDRSGLAGDVVRQQAGVDRPHLTLLAGDQVYLDLPTLTDFRKDTAWLAAKFEQSYSSNWREPTGYGAVLGAAPSVSIPDDHEFWNNAPNSSPIVENSWTEEGRRAWRRAAEIAYSGFQLPVSPMPGQPFGLGDQFVLDVPPLSFFCADMRSQREEGCNRTMNAAGYQALAAWVDRVVDQQLFPVLITGQSLFREPAGFFTGKVGDYELPNYADYPVLVKTLERLIDAGRPLLCLTGDVHWGRVLEMQDMQRLGGEVALREIISSPSSLVSSVGIDQAKELSATLSGVLGRRNPWPRHSPPKAPPQFFAQGVAAKRFDLHGQWMGQTGNHVALLKFRQVAGALEVQPVYWPIHEEPNLRAPNTLRPFYLRPLA